MATVTVTSLSNFSTYLSDLYVTLQPRKSLTVTRATAQLESMAQLQALIAAGTISVSISPTAQELASGYFDKFVPSTTAQAQTVWHINETTGDNANDGLTSGTAIASYDELVRRVGVKWRVNFQVDIYLDSDITQMECSFSIGPSGVVYIHGKRTITSTGTITEFSPNTFLGEATLVTDTGRSSAWNPGEVFRTTGGSNPGAWGWIARDKGGGVARTSGTCTFNIPVDAFNASTAILAPGDPYETETLSSINVITFDVDGAAGAGLTQSHGIVIFIDCHFPRITAASLSAVLFIGCKFDFMIVETTGGFSNCCFTGVMISIVNAGSECGLFLNCFMICYGPWFFNTHPIMQGTSPRQKSGSVLYYEDYVGFFDIANPITVWYGAKIFARHGLYGTGITGDAIQVQAGGQFRYNGTVFAFSGQTNDVTVGGRSTVPRINPTTNVSDGTPLTVSFANIALAFASGGFGGSVNDLYSAASFLQVPDGGF